MKRVFSNRQFFRHDGLIARANDVPKSSDISSFSTRATSRPTGKRRRREDAGEPRGDRGEQFLLCNAFRHHGRLSSEYEPAFV
jgi:hypothetical protein